MNKLIVILVGFVILQCTGCMKDSWFDVKTDKRQAIPTTTSDLQSLLDNGFLFNLGSPTGGELSSDAFYFDVSMEAFLSGFERNYYLWEKLEPNVNVTDWLNSNAGSYRKIYTANLVIELVNKITPSSSYERDVCNNIKGQALFYRGKAFFELAELFVPLISKDNVESKLGIPLRMESDITIRSIRSTVGETYNQIKRDIGEAINLLPISQTLKTRPSKVAAFAQMARILLSIEEYTEAKKYADLALSRYNELLDFNSLELQTGDNPFSGYNSETIFYSAILGTTYFSIPYILIRNEYYEKYSEEDLRKVAYFNYDPGFNHITYKGTFAGRGFDYFFNGLTTGELYLIRAECRARAGETLEAMNDLNSLSRMRYRRPFTDFHSTSSEEALRFVLLEREKEMVLRGTRWSDLRRLNRDPRFVKNFERNYDGSVYTLIPNSFKYTLPIPDDIIQITGIAQNPGWK